ncbi:glycosyltransferase family 2 protein [Priestia koreensis]|uniref:glycosyltransferase family 2 protein n=1 Tax=Priestia koreensis TaxID=284581 RepID=UPI0034593E28
MTHSLFVSVIIPSYNKDPLLRLTLEAFEHQTYQPFEVILVDDGSTDGTFAYCARYKPDYAFTYIRHTENKGRSQARNVGIQKAKGDVLIFLDSEMVVMPDFIQQHAKHHRNHSNRLVTGALYTRTLYTYALPGLSSRQLKPIKHHLGDHPWFARRKEPLQLLTYDDIQQKKWKRLMVEQPYFEEEIIKPFGPSLQGLHMTWLAFFSGNISMRKDFLKTVGDFDEKFLGYGWEDRELGYRFYKQNAQFFGDALTIAYHQEHPIGEDKIEESIRNLLYFYEKHGDITILLALLEFRKPRLSIVQMNSIALQYRSLRELNHTRITKKFEELLRTWAYSFTDVPFVPIKENEPTENDMNLLRDGKWKEFFSLYKQLRHYER